MVQGRPRLFVSAACGIAVCLLLPDDPRMITRLLIGWNAGLWLYFILVAFMITTATDESTARRAVDQDDGRFTILILATFAAIAAFVGIFEQLLMVKELHGVRKGLHITLAAATVVSAWAFIHVMFALHYAHECFVVRDMKATPAAKARGGLKFPGTDAPDYLDFFYFSFVIGVACATADVNITSQTMRRTALVHCVLAFFFNTAVLALMINIAAGLV
jgi:uncharacterized membrane protein